MVGFILRGMLILAPADLIASKIISYYQRRGKPKAGTDWRDLGLLSLAFPNLKAETGVVTQLLQAAKVEQAVLDLWFDFVAQEIEPEDDEY